MRYEKLVFFANIYTFLVIFTQFFFNDEITELFGNRLVRSFVRFVRQTG